jgi:hypothetical protein
MHSLRSAKNLARLVLLWFALSLGAAVASPLIKPQAMELVCSGSGAMKLLVKSDDGSSKETGSFTLDCPLCAASSAPPPLAQLATRPAQALTHVLQPIAAAHIAFFTAAPLPARGPPAFS